MTEPQPQTVTLLSSSAFDPSHPRALAISCADGRFTRSVEELVRYEGHDRLDTLTVPGGPALLSAKTAAPTERAALSRAASFLIAGHAIVEAVLVAHEGCGYYRARYERRSPGEIERLQIEDLRAAARWLRGEHPSLEVNLYYARPLEGRVAFHAVPLE